MAKLKISGFDLGMALESPDEMQNYLNAETGEIVCVCMGEINGGDIKVDDVDEYLESSDFRAIRPMDSRESFQVMDDFVDTLPAGTQRSKLREALAGPRPFRRFKDAIYDFPDLRDSWNRFEELRHREYLTEMIAGFGIDAEIDWPALPEPAPPPRPVTNDKERVLLEFPWSTQRGPSFAMCRFILRKTKKRSTIHIDYYDDDIFVAEGLAIAPEDIDPLIEALLRIKAEL